MRLQARFSHAAWSAPAAAINALPAKFGKNAAEAACTRYGFSVSIFMSHTRPNPASLVRTAV
jgi:hypothetical protein